MAQGEHLQVEAYDSTWPDNFDRIRTYVQPVLEGPGASMPLTLVALEKSSATPSEERVAPDP